jgi:hypothetical protein
MAPIPSTIISSGSKQKEFGYICLSKTKASHSHKMWTEVSSSIPHFLQVALLHHLIIYKCVFKVLCLVSRPTTTLDCVLLQGNNRIPVARSGPEIKSRACLCVLQGPRQSDILLLHPAFYFSTYILPREPQEWLRSNKPLNKTNTYEYVSDFISSQSGMPWDPI